MSNEPAPTPDDPSGPSSADAVHAVMRFARVVLHRKTYVFSSLVLAGLLGGLYYFTATRIYQANAQLLILSTGAETWSPNMRSAGDQDALIPTYERLFSSVIVLDGAIKELVQGPSDALVDLATLPREKWVDTLRSNLSAKAIRRTNVIEISYKSKSAKAAEAVVQAIVESYLAFMESNHKNVSAEIVTILDKDRKELDDKLAEKTKDLLSLKKRVRDLGINEKERVVHPTVQRVITLSDSLVKVQQERLQLEASSAAVRTAVRDGADLRQHLTELEPIIGRELMMNTLGLNTSDAQTRAGIERQAMEDRARLRTLLEHYGEAHPKVVEATQAIRNAEDYLHNYQQMASDRLACLQDGRLGPMLLGMVEEKLVGLWEHERKLAAQYQQAESEAVHLNERVAELRIAEHELDRIRNLHDTLLNRIANIDIGRDHSDVRVAVVSEPKASNRPVSPRLSLVGMLCLLGGLGLGIAFVYVQDVMDDHFRSPEELQEQLGAPLLAMIREFSNEATSGVQALQVHVSPSSVESEGFRTLRTTLAFSGRDTERVAVTSAEPSDGKTTVLSNLGVSCALAGKRTLLIDCDLRRPGLTKLFELRGQGGVSEILRSEGELGEMCAARVQATEIEHLHVLPSGPKPSNPAELLSGLRLGDMLAWAEANYDQVIVDCPPILAAADAAIVGRLTEGLILVIQPEKNHRRLVLRAVASLASMGVGIMGIVANKIGGENGTSYYGYGGYGYGGYGYGADHGENAEEDEPESQPATLNFEHEVAEQHESHSQTERGAAQRVVPRRAA
ncbi:MAG: polysaccharide biosynthesis tyrosine autokinase [Planctomycetota bacterium]|nr:polysaccharide biosynthesis tyrosine autokinase [Planctomycetota bacterium]